MIKRLLLVFSSNIYEEIEDGNSDKLLSVRYFITTC